MFVKVRPRLNNHRKDVKDPNALPADKHFTLPRHNFSNNVKVSYSSPENFWRKKLKTLKPH